MLGVSQHAQTHHMWVIICVLFNNRHICNLCCFITLNSAEMSQSPLYVSWFIQNSWGELNYCCEPFDLAFERLGLEDALIPYPGVWFTVEGICMAMMPIIYPWWVMGNSSHWHPVGSLKLLLRSSVWPLLKVSLFVCRFKMVPPGKFITLRRAKAYLPSVRASCSLQLFSSPASQPG